MLQHDAAQTSRYISSYFLFSKHIQKNNLCFMRHGSSHGLNKCTTKHFLFIQCIKTISLVLSVADPTQSVSTSKHRNGSLPLSHRPFSSSDHMVARRAPRNALKKPKSRVVSIAFPRTPQQRVPSPSCPVQWRQSLPRV